MLGTSASFSPLLIGERSATSKSGRTCAAKSAFSPLLIGERSATNSTTVYAGWLILDFQSPPHRGTVCNLRAGRLGPGTDCRFQSPPHRGTVCNIRQALTLCGTCGFQSPPHRGTVCNTKPTCLVRRGALLSVPSSSGNGLQPGDPVKGPPLRISLSVPSSSGNGLQPAVARAGDGSGVCLSVPSSSGNGLQLMTDQVASERTFPFSPLLIGERSATLPAFQVREHNHGSFSPLLIGERSATIAARNAWRDCGFSFSPLLIGERSATWEKARNASISSCFQSPPHRGTVCNVKTPAAGPGMRGELSVPSSSGNGLQPRPITKEIGRVPATSQPQFFATGKFAEKPPPFAKINPNRCPAAAPAPAKPPGRHPPCNVRL